VLELGYVQEYITRYKACINPNCPEYHKLLGSENPNVAPGHTMGYALQAEIAHNRFHSRTTENEIQTALKSDQAISTSKQTIGDIIRTYEFGCANWWDPSLIEQIKKQGFMVLHIDVIEPMKGKHGILTIFEHYSKAALGSIILQDGSNKGYQEFFQAFMVQIKTIFDVPIVAVISDALPAQRIAIEKGFPEAKHCICHYHFFEYVFREAFRLDEHIVTQIRAEIRQISELREYKKLKSQEKRLPFAYQTWRLFLELLLPCMDWKPQKEDPCFSSIRLMEILCGLHQELTLFQIALLNEDIRIDKRTRKTMEHMQKHVASTVNTYQMDVSNLEIIYGYASELKEVLNAHESTSGEGLKRISILLEYWNHRKNEGLCKEFEKTILEEIKTYLDTKTVQLFNYRTIEGAPSTNNFEESRFHLLKHQIRRTIGQSSAKEYLARHGPHLFFVKPDADLDQIKKILQVTDQTEARKILDRSRPSRFGIGSLIHKSHAWVVLSVQFRKLFQILTEQTQNYGEVKMSPREYLMNDTKGEDLTQYFLL